MNDSGGLRRVSDGNRTRHAQIPVKQTYRTMAGGYGDRALSTRLPIKQIESPSKAKTANCAIRATSALVALVALSAMLVGCDVPPIRACGYWCSESGGRMVSYSADAGCRCEYPDTPSEVR